MIAKYPGTCARTGRAIKPGDRIFMRRGRVYSAEDTPAAEEKRVSDVFTIGGQEFYRNKKGRCEDAPCCGCCNI